MEDSTTAPERAPRPADELLDAIAGNDALIERLAAAAASALGPSPWFELERTVRELRADLEHLRRSIATEVRTRRVAVVESDGFERVVISGVDCPSNAGVHVYARSQARPADRTTSTQVSLYAVEDEAYDKQEEVGLMLWGAGNDYGTLELSRAADVEDNDVDPVFWPRYEARLVLNTDQGEAALQVNHEGVKVHPSRLHNERARLREQHIEATPHVRERRRREAGR